MKLKDLFKMIESENNFNKFIGNIERKVVKLDERGFNEKIFDNIKDFIKVFNEEFYGELTKDTELINDNGYIKFTLEYQRKSWNGTEVIYVPESNTYHLYIDNIQVWN